MNCVLDALLRSLAELVPYNLRPRAGVRSRSALAGPGRKIISGASKEITPESFDFCGRRLPVLPTHLLTMETSLGFGYFFRQIPEQEFWAQSGQLGISW